MTEKKPGGAYVELHAASAFSFLRGASLPEDLAAAAAERGLPAAALCDAGGVYGAPRFFQAAREAGLRALVGAEVPTETGRLTLLVRDRRGYRNLCRLLTEASRGRPKGEARATAAMVEAHAEGLHCLTGGGEGPVARRIEEGDANGARALLARLSGVFRGRIHVELQRHLDRGQERRNQALAELAQALRLPLVATNGVRFAHPADKDLLDALDCIRLRTNLLEAGRRLEPNRERSFKSAAEMAALFPDFPEAVAESARVAEQLDFTLADLGYRFPDCVLPPGETPISHLTRLVRREAPRRFRPVTPRVRAQLEKELALIGKLGLAGYFLIVRDIVEFCRREGILVQGRGSAANSAVCYALSITAVDPVKMDLLFERFLSEERGEWPDIDLDLPSGEQREKVIQHVFARYGPHGAAMTANVITYRRRSAAREVAKALGFPSEWADRLSRQLSGPDAGAPEKEVAAAGLDPKEERVRHFTALWRRLQNLPRHLGQHSGGMVIAAGRLDEVVPIEPAAMPGRAVVQWDKDDCADLGIIKVDLLGLGMLAAVEEAIPMIRRCEGVEVDLARLPPDDPKVFAMLAAADTVGVFQLESRAQMATLPRNAPRRFYDIVTQVAIIRPGPITGGMMNAFFERRRDPSKVDYPHPSLQPILERTLGVPLFQEQLLRIAMTAAGFSGGQAEELRRAMGFKRSVERMAVIESKLRAGMDARGIGREAQEKIIRAITSFALYGFPESHAASFALIAYATAYLKAYHPAAFYASILNAWPMGFYHPATLVKDAQRHRIEVRPADVARSGWACRWEEGGVRMGLRFILGLHRATGEAIEREQALRPFDGLEDLGRRCGPAPGDLERLAYAGALAPFGLSRRDALWQAARVASPAGPLFSGIPEPGGPSLPPMSPAEETLADYESLELTTGPHILAHYRAELARAGVETAARLHGLPEGRRVRAGGSIVVRQRPETAKGFVFLTLEDETGMVQAIVPPGLFRAQKPVIVGETALLVEGILQKDPGSTQVSVRAERFWPLRPGGGIPSHDFH